MSRSLGLTAEARSAVFAPLDGPGRSEQVERRLREAIVLGLVGHGERLPRETELARQFGVAVSTVREALDALRGQGLVRTTRGRDGGSFITSTDAGQRELLADRLAQFSRAQLHDLALQLGSISGSVASTAATRATPVDLDGLLSLNASIDFGDEVSTRRGEGLFRVEMAAVAQSPRLVIEELRLQSEFGPLLWLGLRDQTVRDHVRGAQLALIEALRQGDAVRARHLVDAQLAVLVTSVIALSDERAAGADAAGGAGAAADAAGGASADAAAGTSGPAPVVSRIEDSAELVASTFDRAFASLGRARDAFEEKLGALAHPVTKAALDDSVRDLAEAELGTDSGAQLVIGAGFVATPGFVTDAPWHLAWWVRQQGDPLVKRLPPRQLAVVEDAESEFFRDYTRLEWWRGVATGAPSHVTGPYVDYLCTDEFILTLTMPVIGVGGEQLGVAGVDVPVSALERRFLPDLSRLGTRLTLVNAASRVILSTDPTIAAGTLLGSDGERMVCGGLPLVLVQH
ncbi:GntR family transcriptional regulator [Agreia sp. COWG]|uniref:GntR family transcriptional regulator n=1 Tax=Agreia sp. COWG TaxID=2773266 RepID=UPI00192863F3|nr:GntR family transcriptional regulator [Agreia sp. COWG]CAD6007114.1 HTH gntR-type domain-containing protein [Agreia sp. COWG]